MTESIISDHNIVNCSLNLLKPTLMKRDVSLHIKLNQLTLNDLNQTFAIRLALTLIFPSNVNDLVSRYCSELTRIMDNSMLH